MNSSSLSAVMRSCLRLGLIMAYFFFFFIFGGEEDLWFGTRGFFSRSCPQQPPTCLLPWTFSGSRLWRRPDERWPDDRLRSCFILRGDWCSSARFWLRDHRPLTEWQESLSGCTSNDYERGSKSSCPVDIKVYPSAMTKLLPHASEVTRFVSKCCIS